MFAGGKLGVSYDTATLISLFQDRSLTPVTPASVNGVVGTRKDLSGNNNHQLAPSDAARPVLRTDGAGRYWLEYDLIDDRIIAAATIAAVGATGAMFYGCGVTNTGTGVPIFSGVSPFTGATESGAGNSPATGSGSPTFNVDGVAISPQTRGALFTALTSASGVTPHLLESRSTNCTGYTALATGSYAGASKTVRDYGLTVISEADLGANQAALRTWFGQRMGLSL
jgi:hypothetical protein